MTDRKIKIYILILLDPMTREAIDSYPYGNMKILCDKTGIKYNHLREGLNKDGAYFHKDIEMKDKQEIGIKLDALVVARDLERGERTAP